MTGPRSILLGSLVTLCVAVPATAQTVITPTVSVNIKTSPGFLDLDEAANEAHAGVGVAVSRLSDGWLGFEGEATLTPSAFSGGDLVTSSRLLTATGSVLAMLPERWRLRPYVSLGAGIANIQSMDVGEIFAVDATPFVVTAGAGVWTWPGPRVGIRAGIRFLRSLRSIDASPFETWQPSVGVSLRF